MYLMRIQWKAIVNFVACTATQIAAGLLQGQPQRLQFHQLRGQSRGIPLRAARQLV